MNLDEFYETREHLESAINEEEDILASYHAELRYVIQQIEYLESGEAARDYEEQHIAYMGACDEAV